MMAKDGASQLYHLTVSHYHASLRDPSSPSATIPYFLSFHVVLSSRSSDYRKRPLKCP